MFVMYKFTCKANHLKDFEVGVDDSMDMNSYIDAMVRTGFEVEGPDNIVYTVNGAIAIELKEWPKTITCSHCGLIMDLVSIDEGYSCRNKGCLLHFKHLEHA